MPTTIEKLYANQGYIDAIDFFNAESTSPTVGDHTFLVTNLFDAISGQDYFFFLVELYSDENTYSGPLIVFQDYILFIEGGSPRFLQIDQQLVADLFTVSEETGLIQFFSGEIALNNNSGDVTDKTLEVYRSVSFGAERWYVRIKDGSSSPLFTGVISSKIVEDSVLSCYNVKVDQLPYTLITVRSARKYLQNFTVRISELEQRDYTYRTMNQILYVPDTPFARKDLQRLVRAGVVFAPV